MQNTSIISSLIIGYLRKELNEKELHELQEWIEADPANELLFKELTEQPTLAHMLGAFNGIDISRTEEKIREIMRGDKLTAVRPVQQEPSQIPPTHFVLRRTKWIKYAAAVLIVFGTGAYLWNNLKVNHEKPGAIQPAVVQNDVLPGSNRAVLTLSDGKKVELNNTASETIKDGSLSIENNDGRLIYGGRRNTLHEGGSNVVVNTMTTPKGGQYQLTLSDGTKVWLNAASSITYPTVFAGKTREVNVTGEIYFEVARNKSKPFIVKTISNEITVLGTSFNINTYSDEKFKTSLVEGSVKVGLASSETLSPAGGSTRPKAGGGWTLKPGEAFSNGKIIKTDIEQDVAWKNGYFNFNGTDLPAVMRQLARWYDIEVKYVGEIPQLRLRGKMQRELSLQQVLEVLQEMHLRFKIEGKTLLVE